MSPMDELVYLQLVQDLSGSVTGNTRQQAWAADPRRVLLLMQLPTTTTTFFGPSQLAILSNSGIIGTSSNAPLVFNAHEHPGLVQASWDVQNTVIGSAAWSAWGFSLIGWPEGEGDLQGSINALNAQVSRLADLITSLLNRDRLTSRIRNGG